MRGSSKLRAESISNYELHIEKIHFTIGEGFINISSNTKNAPIILDDIDVRELQARLENTEMVCKELYSVVSKQSELINALWYAPGPGGPGIYEAKEEFENVQAKEKEEK